MYCSTAWIAYGIDRLFGEFPRVRHPVVWMGHYIAWFEARYYADSISRGAILVLSLIVWVGGVSCGLVWLIAQSKGAALHAILSGILGSSTLASKMLYDSVRQIATHPHAIRFLVSRDTDNLTPSEINKAAIETYAENLSDGVVAPLVYLLLFGLPGAFVYKAVNTLDSMVGYRSEHYERFGKCAARLDDVANYIPARITALMIFFIQTQNNRQVTFREVVRQGRRHASINAGIPIAAMGHRIGVTLGGPTAYSGMVKKKPFLGRGSTLITTGALYQSLTFQPFFDAAVLGVLSCCVLGGYVWG